MRKTIIILSLCILTGSVAAQEIASAYEEKPVKDKGMDNNPINDIVYFDDDSSRINLMKAAWKGDLNIVKQAAADGADLDFSDENGNTLLMGAASSGNNELVKFLLSKGVNVKAEDPSGETALHYAAWKGNLEMTETLVEAGADVNAFYRANGGLTPLNCAAESGSLETVKYLVTKGAEIDYENPESGSSPLRAAAYSGHFEIFKFIADRKKEIDWQETLGYAVRGGNLDIVKYIVEEKKANPQGNTKYFHSTIIQRAAEKKFNRYEDQDVPMIKYLLSKGAYLGEINNGKIFPWAMDNCSKDVINFFLEIGVKFYADDTDRYGWPPLPAALDNDDFELAKSLLKDTNPSFRGWPLIVYFSDGLGNSYDIVSFLINNGVNRDSYSPAFLNSVAHGDLKTAQLLLDVGADINFTDDDGYNALFFTNDYDIANFLISKGIKTDNKELPAYALTRFNLLRALDENKIDIPVSPAEATEGLLRAVENGKDWAAKFFLSKGADVNYKFKPRAEEKNDWREGMTPLIINVYAGYDKVSYHSNMVSPQTAEILIQVGADINAKDKTGKTALHYATGRQYYYVMIWPIPTGSRRERESGEHIDPAMPPRQNRDAIAELLVKSGADINIKDSDGNTPLLLSAINSNYGAMKILLKAGAKTNIKNKENKTMFDYLDEEEGFKIVTEAGLGSKIPKKAINNAFVKIVKEYGNRYRYDRDGLARIIALGADVNTPVDGKNVLHYVLYRDNNLPDKYDFFKQLIAAGVDVNAKNEEGMGVLAFAVYKKKKADLPLIKLLIDSGARVDDVDDSHISALTIANVSEYQEAAEILKEAGAKRDITAEWWYTLYWRYDDVTRFKALVDEGVNINVKTTYAVHANSSAGFKGNGMTILMHTAERVTDRNNRFIKEFIKWGADVNARDNDGRTALHYLARTRMYEGDYKESAGKETIPKRIADFYTVFKQAGGDINIKDKTGKTACDYAAVTLPPLATLIKRDL